MITGMLAVRNILFGETNDLWSVNADAEYHEEIRHDGKKKSVETLKEKITHGFPWLDLVALGIAFGITAGILIFAATLFLVIKDGVEAGPNWHGRVILCPGLLSRSRELWWGYSICSLWIFCRIVARGIRGI